MPQNKTRLSESSALPRHQVFSAVFLSLALCAVFVGGLWYFYAQARDHLDDTLGLRLQNVAVTAAATVPGDSLLTWLLTEDEPVDVTLLTGTLKRVEVDNSLSKIVVYHFDRTVLLDTSRILTTGETDPFLGLDLPAVEQALVGVPSYSDLQEVSGSFLKAGYAPIFDAYSDVGGFVGVVGSAEFFDTLTRLRRTLFLVGVVTVIFVLLASAAYLGYARRLAMARAALARSETLSAMGRMAAGIAHEIRNPLGIIKNTAQLLREDLADMDGDVDRELLDFIPEEVDRLNETLTGYLDFAKDAPPRMQDTDLSRVVSRTIKVMRPDFEHARVEVLDNLQDVGQLRAQVDPRRMQQVFMNLFLNSIQAMPHGGRLQIELDGSSQELRACVRDTGVGVEATAAAHVFDPFVTTKDKGSGLGLSVVQKIVQDHGGTIQMESKPGEGAVVTMVLPRNPATRRN